MSIIDINFLDCQLKPFRFMPYYGALFNFVFLHPH
jgi:hypothetical protein